MFLPASLILLNALTSPAEADCPYPFDDEEILCDDVCTFDDGVAKMATCDFSDSASTSANAKFVTPATYEFRAYGTNQTGVSFCCEHTFGTAAYAVAVTGSLYNDDLELADIAESLFLNCGYNAVNGGDGDDHITGSPAMGDVLNGNDGDDTISGRNGNDEIQGGVGDDTINGSEDNDTIFGNDDFDVIHGDGGIDTINGGPNDDDIYGDDGNDRDSDGGILEGGTGSDLICGGLGEDDMYGQGGNDFLFGGAGLEDYANGGTETDYCNAESNDYCEGALADCSRTTP